MFKNRYTISIIVTLLLLGGTFLAALPSAGATLSAPAPDVAEQAQVGPPPTWFLVRVENISDGNGFPVPYAPGVWAVHTAADPLFTAGQMDAGMGLEALAEDGDPSALAAALPGQTGIESSGVFNTPVGATGPGPLAPGHAYQFLISTTMTTTQLSLATMFVHSNDIFAAPDGMGIPLFGPDGTLGTLELGTRDVTDMLSFWDSGTELNEPPGMGPNQAPHQGDPDTGPAEGVVSLFSNTTRGLPLAGGLVDVSVAETGGTFTVTVENVSAARGAITTPMAPVFYATHDDTWQLFEDGASAGTDGLESLAEDGSPAALVSSYTGAMGTGTVGAQDTPTGGSPGPAAPGENYQFSVTPDATHRFLTIATMVVESNDVFVAFVPAGVALLDEAGTVRSVDDVNADIARLLAVWDAGTEVNQVPGVGPDQPLRQSGADTGADDPNDSVRRYADTTNDLAGPMLGGFADVSVTSTGDPLSLTFSVAVTNTSDTTAYPGALTPVLWATHNMSASLFTEGISASAGLESLAEDGDPTTLLAEVNASADVAVAGVAGMAPLPAGSSLTFSVTAAADYRYLSMASMVVPSNDTFMAFQPEGIALLTEAGTPRSDADIAADVAAQLAAWDAGTERNQAGAAGPDQAPRQDGPDTGADEGNSTVRHLMDPVWTYPALSDTLRVTITPLTSHAYLPILVRNAE